MGATTIGASNPNRSTMTFRADEKRKLPQTLFQPLDKSVYLCFIGASKSVIAVARIAEEFHPILYGGRIEASFCGEIQSPEFVEGHTFLPKGGTEGDPEFLSLLAPHFYMRIRRPYSVKEALFGFMLARALIPGAGSQEEGPKPRKTSA